MVVERLLSYWVSVTLQGTVKLWEGKQALRKTNGFHKPDHKAGYFLVDSHSRFVACCARCSPEKCEVQYMDTGDDFFVESFPYHP